MTAFTPSLPVDTTPWLTSEKENKDFYLFNHAYTNFPATAGALSMALTGINQYNEKKLVRLSHCLMLLRKQVTTPGGSAITVSWEPATLVWISFHPVLIIRYGLHMPKELILISFLSLKKYRETAIIL